MKTHSLAKELIALGEALINGPNIDTSKLKLLGLDHAVGSRSDEKMVIGITTLAQLSRFKKSEWVQFVKEHDLPIPLNTRDSARDLVGKIMNYFANNDHEINRVRNSIRHSDESSNRLNQALNTLLKASSA